MHRFASGTWKTNWRTRWRALDSGNHPWGSYLKHWVNKKRTSVKFKTFWRANWRMNSVNSAFLRFSPIHEGTAFSWHNLWNPLRFSQHVYLAKKKKYFFLLSIFYKGMNKLYWKRVFYNVCLHLRSNVRGCNSNLVFQRSFLSMTCWVMCHHVCA